MMKAMRGRALGIFWLERYDYIIAVAYIAMCYRLHITDVYKMIRTRYVNMLFVRMTVHVN